MNNIKTILLILFCNLSVLISSSAENKTAGIWTEIAVSKTIRSFVLGVNSEVMTKENGRTLDRIGLGFKADYQFLKWLNTGVGFEFIDFKRISYYELKGRYYIQLEPLFHFSNFFCSFRERLQFTRSMEPQYNSPDFFYWRNRFEVFYKKSSWKVEPILNLEQWYRIGDYDHRITTGYRISIGANFHPGPKHKIKAYGMITDGTIISQVLVGLTYILKL